MIIQIHETSHGLINNERSLTIFDDLSYKHFSIITQDGDSYHFDLFLVERKLCRSRIFLETSDIKFYQSTSDDPAMDYFVDVAEDLYLDATLAAMNLVDMFSTANYNIDIVMGKI